MKVSLVIPGRNASRTIGPCLEAVVPLIGRNGLEEIIFVDDGSTDDTAEIVRGFPVRYILGDGRGAGSARNLGWRAARNPVIWFIDSDCVAEADALERLLPHLEDPRVGGASGSYGNMEEGSLLACLIHEEIIQRHLAMPTRVNFLATFNVVYRREILEQVGGFDERFLKGQDAELSWRVLAAEYELGFEVSSRVKHFHPCSLRAYLRTQRQQGYWRLWLHLTHRGHAGGDSYSSAVDHIQPPLAMLLLASVPLALVPQAWFVPPTLALLLTLAQVPMTARIVSRSGRLAHLAYAPMSFVRAFARGFGLSAAVLSGVFRRRSDRDTG